MTTATPFVLVLVVLPLAACAVMASAVWLVHTGLMAVGAPHPAIFVAAEIIVGALAYVVAAFVLCRETTIDLLALLKKALER